MIEINFNNYQVYYMDNDGRKQILLKNISYSKAVKNCQYWQSRGLSTSYETIKTP